MNTTAIPVAGKNRALRNALAVVLLLCVAAVALACGGGGRIVFFSGIDGNTGLYAVNADGSGEKKRLVDNPASAPVWLPAD